jgi:hypothetical protein
MTSCKGFGECFEQCEYNCDNQNHTHFNSGETDTIYSQNECSHKCVLVECHNYKVCGQKRPAWVLDCHNGMCLDCALMIGKLTFLEQKDDCPVYMEHKEMVQVCCGKHTLCITCWLKMSEIQPDSENYKPLSCPMCRTSIWK